jgi:Transcriptional regulator, effector-binding domain/component
MKALKILFSLILLAAIGLVAIGLLGSKNFHIERSIVINASPSAIYPHMANFSKRSAWSPWEKKDPNIKKSMDGSDGQIGTTSKWDSDHPEVGSGQETFTAMKVNERVDSHLEFFKPFESEADAFVFMDEAEKGTKVTWGFKGDVGFVERIVFFFNPLDAAMQKEFDSGLASLKEIVESSPALTTQFEIQEIDYPAQHFVVTRETVKIENIQKFYQENLPKLFQTCMSKKLEMDGQPCGIFFTYDEEKNESDMAAAVPVKKAMDLGENMKAFTQGNGKALLIDYYGDYEGSVHAHNAMMAYIEGKNYKIGPSVIEQYITDPTTEADPNKWLTKIYYFLES